MMKMDSTLSTATLTSSIYTTSSYDRTSNDSEKSIHINFDTSISAVQLECVIQAERINAVYRVALKNIKLIVCLTRLIKKPHILRNILSREHYSEVMSILLSYTDDTCLCDDTKTCADVNSSKNVVTLLKRQSQKMSRVIFILTKYTELMKIVDMNIACDRNKVPPALRFLNWFELFYKHIEELISLTAEMKLQRKLRIRRLVSENNVYKEKIRNLRSELLSEKMAFDNIMNAKQLKIEELNSKAEELLDNNLLDIKKHILYSERLMVMATRSHVHSIEWIREDHCENKLAYYSCQNNNLDKEKTLRSRRTNLEQILFEWLQKYDHDIGALQAQQDAILDEMEFELDIVVDLEEELRIQNLDYIPLMKDRDKEYVAEMTQKMKEFRLEHAVRVTQRDWREVLECRKDRKRKARLAKKLEKERLIQEKAAERQAKKEKALEKARRKAEKEAKKLEKMKKKADRAAAKAAEKEAQKLAEKLAKEAKEKLKQDELEAKKAALAASNKKK